MSGQLCLSVDLDGLHHYRAIHGLTGASGVSGSIAPGLTRFLDLFKACDIRATFFVIARDLDDPALVTLLKQALTEGHEVANHSLDHPYDLIRLDPIKQQQQIEQAHRKVANQLGVAMTGFRAPGYLISHEILDILEGLNYSYDSSVFPCPWYFGAKAGVLASMKLRRKQSNAIFDAHGMSFAPSQPYRPGRKRWWRRGERKLLELPVAVTPFLRLPLIGTMTPAGPFSLGVLARMCGWRPFIGFACHAIDLMDEDDIGVGEDLRAVQPDLHFSTSEKTYTLTRIIRLLQRRHESMTLQERSSLSR